MKHWRTGIVTVTREVAAPAQAVWDVLADGWFYATWVVGASRVRGVDHEWPAEGARIHHSFGVWPAVISDTTHVLQQQRAHRARAAGQGLAGRRGEGRHHRQPPRPTSRARVAMAEDAVTGPGTLVPRPLRQLAIGPRNVEALRRLAYLAEGRHRERVTSG